MQAECVLSANWAIFSQGTSKRSPLEELQSLKTSGPKALLRNDREKVDRNLPSLGRINFQRPPAVDKLLSSVFPPLAHLRRSIVLWRRLCSAICFLRFLL
ncbi:unnamed protein product [Caenorhabditis auriculariae]|uniref:Uncharacterized protein n=1 Tax=Caenorhabditis auriculariae TaxID=2777116 RepID=A0A8S1H6D2_9PELO|nr:unnamed protein product [Caenorhabditis auriculariae]